MERLKIVSIGNKGEHEIAMIFKNHGIYHIRRPDFCIFAKKMWMAIEVKNKEPFQPPPAYMQGMPKTQYNNDLNMTHLGMPCVLIVRGKNSEWLAQWIIKLKPEPDPRKRVIAQDQIVWFGLDQFKPLSQFLKEVEN